MKNKLFAKNLLKTVLILLVCHISGAVLMFLGSIFCDRIMVDTVPGAVTAVLLSLMIVPPLILGGRLKDTGSTFTNLASVFLPGFIDCILMYVLMRVFLSDDSIGFIVAFMNAPAFLLTARFIEDSSALSLVIGSWPLCLSLLMGAGFLLRQRRGAVLRSFRSGEAPIK